MEPEDLLSEDFEAEYIPDLELYRVVDSDGKVWAYAPTINEAVTLTRTRWAKARQIPCQADREAQRDGYMEGDPHVDA
jgi:hypothetical protein